MTVPSGGLLNNDMLKDSATATYLLSSSKFSVLLETQPLRLEGLSPSLVYSWDLRLTFWHLRCVIWNRKKAWGPNHNSNAKIREDKTDHGVLFKLFK